MCADHGYAFGEYGHHGRGIAHSTVLNVPFKGPVVRVGGYSGLFFATALRAAKSALDSHGILNPGVLMD